MSACNMDGVSAYNVGGYMLCGCYTKDSVSPYNVGGYMLCVCMLY